MTAFSSSLDNFKATETAPPDEIPEKIPSFAARSRVVFSADS
jgi:hypothetical protein